MSLFWAAVRACDGLALGQDAWMPGCNAPQAGGGGGLAQGLGGWWGGCGVAPPPPPVSNEQFGPKLIQSEQECSLDTPFGARDNIVTQR